MLSTHIVEDVAQLCPRFAIISRGRLVANTTPEQALQAIEGSIFEASITAASYQQLVSDPDAVRDPGVPGRGQQPGSDLSTRGEPPDGFRPVDATLEDAYLVVIKTGGLPGRDTARTRSGRHRRRCLMSLAAAPRSACPRSLHLACAGSWPSARQMPLIMPRRPLFWIWTMILVLGAWGMSTGTLIIQSGDSSVGGTKAWITSEFAVAKQLSILTLILYAFFLAIAAGMTIIQDAEWRLGDLLHATSLEAQGIRLGQVRGGCWPAVLGVLAIHLLAMVFFFQVLPGDAEKDIAARSTP